MLTGIASLVVTLLAAIYTAIILPTLQQYLSARATQLAKQREEAEAEQAKINLTYLNPLRLWLEETYVRLADISARLAETDHCEPLLFIETPGAISEQSLTWFNGAGCYLTSTCYITTCLFFAIKQVRDNIPYLRLSRRSDKALMTLLFGVSHGFLRDFGIYYVTQPSIGNDIYLAAQGRLMTYREYCQWLRLPENRLWCDRLIELYLETGRGQHRDRLSALLTAIAALSDFLDEHIGEGVSLAERLRAEKITNPKPIAPLAAEK